METDAPAIRQSLERPVVLSSADGEPQTPRSPTSPLANHSSPHAHQAPTARYPNNSANDDGTGTTTHAADMRARNVDQLPSMSSHGGSKRTCAKCGKGLAGQFVRALDNTYHLECFTCHECGKIVASKFFPEPEQPPHEYPLCETDYFKRLDLLCFSCGGALRGSYITALDRKYHIEHFTCSICPTVFGAQDSYYEHEGSVYCHYHYSTRFAQKCNGCQTAILKQFVEIYRNGQNQHWHPECYMIHKYWNVRLHTPTEIASESRGVGENGDASDLARRIVRDEEAKIEIKVLWIWRTLSSYEEKSATCISDMLLHVSNGAYVDGIMTAKRFIVHIDLLFTAADDLDNIMTAQTTKGLSYSREAKLLCRKVVAFFQLLAETQDTGVRRLGVTQELLSLVTGLAHYLKLLIRICLQGALKFEREAHSEQGLREFLATINLLDERLANEQSLDISTDISAYVSSSADTCPICIKPVEDRCMRQGQTVFHIGCFICSSCQHDLTNDALSAVWNDGRGQLRCNNCAGLQSSPGKAYIAVSRLQQYVHLLKVAHARLLATLRTSGALPHTSDDPNLDKYDSQSGHRIPSTSDLNEPPLLRSNTRSRSYAGKSALEDVAGPTYDDSPGNVRRMRSTRMRKEASNIPQQPWPSMTGENAGFSISNFVARASNEVGRRPFPFVVGRSLSHEPVSQLNFGLKDSIRLEDIPRIVALEQAKEQRPNANKFSKGRLIHNEPKPRIVSTHRRDNSGFQDLDKFGPEGHRPKKYFSELSALEYFIVRHVAVLSMEPLLGGQFNQEDLLNLIETRKPTFWGKFGKAFKQDKTKGGKKKGVFGVSLDSLAERDGVESSDGVSPGALRIPALIQDAISAMRTMDMSMEGVFRKNGNIRRLKEMADIVNEKGGEALDLNLESPVQVAALLKKFLRELPDPVLTFKLHRLFIASQKLADEETQRRVLHLTCCLLPKAHRDTLEVLFCFLNWVASFSVVDEESGSKMDVHNLATVIAPNILFSSSKTEEMEDSFLAIEAVHCLIECNESMCQVPEDLQSILNDSHLFSGSADITTKEILKRYADIGRPVPVSSNSPNGNGITAKNIYHSTTSSRESRGNSPLVTRMSFEAPTRSAGAAAAWLSESPLRPQEGAGIGTPPRFSQNGFAPHADMYGDPATAQSSRDSLGLGVNSNAVLPTGSPSRYYSRPGADSKEQTPIDPAAARPHGGIGVT